MAMPNQEPLFTHYALLIGIDAYPEKPLRGCVRDVREIKKYLDGIPKPAVIRTRMFTASQTKESTRPIEEPSLLPTYKNVVGELKGILLNAKEGDFVYIHFSGHGTAFRPPLQSSPLHEFSNYSTGDLALTLLHDDGIKIHYLRGLELAYLLRDMVQKKLLVTVVLDCCFSGSVMRKDASVRYFDYISHIDLVYPPMNAQSQSPEDEASHLASRTASMRPNWLVDPDGYTILTACGPSEIAKEIVVDGEAHGALSYFLTRMFAKLGGIGGRQRDIYQYLRTKFRETQEQHQHNQNPMLYGNKDLYFLGQVNSRIGPTPVPLLRTRHNHFQLDAGLAHGVCKGDKLSVWAVILTGPAKGDFVYPGNPGTAMVTHTRALTSDIELMEPNTFVPTGAELVATALTHLSLRKFPVQLQLSVPYPDGWTKALQEHQSLEIYHTGDVDRKDTFSFSLGISTNNSYDISDNLGNILLSVPIASLEPTQDASQVLDAVEHLAKFEMVRTLKNDLNVDTVRAFEESFSVQLINPAGVRVDPGCSRDRRIYQECKHPECRVELEDGACVELEVTNKEKEGGHSIYVHVYCMGSSWEIENANRGDYEVVPSRRSNQNEEFRKGASGVWKKKLKMSVPLELREKGQSYCEDIVKVFVTAQPTSFLSLELPELGRWFERTETTGSRDRGGSTGGASEDWATFNFSIRTYTK